MKVRKKGYMIWLVVTIIFTLAAISTVIPQDSVSKVCLLQYKAHCSFTPISTILCLLIAGGVCKMRKNKFIEEKE